MAADRLIAEELLLLAWDADTGRPHRALATSLPAAVGGALLVDLTLRDRLRVEVAAPRANARPTGDPLLDAVVAELRAGPRRRPLRRWVRRVGTNARRDEVRDRLAATGALHPEPATGAHRRARHLVTDADARSRRLTQIHQLLSDGRRADPQLIALAALVGASPLLELLTPRSERRDARRRAERLAAAPTLTAATRAVLRDTQAALRMTRATSAASTSHRATLTRR